MLTHISNLHAVCMNMCALSHNLITVEWIQLHTVHKRGPQSVINKWVRLLSVFICAPHYNLCVHICVWGRWANLTEPRWDSGSRLLRQTESYWWLGSWRTHFSSTAYLSGYPVLGSHRALTELILSSFVTEKDKDVCVITGLFYIWIYF